MSYYRRVVKKRSACLTEEEWLALVENGRVVRDYFRARDGVKQLPVMFSTLLCPSCRERHSPAEVETCMALPRKSPGSESSSSSTSNALDPGPLKQYSELWAFLTATTFPDGTKRQAGKFSVSFESGLLGLLLSDGETGQYAFLNGRDLTGLLDEAELRLADGSLSFRPSRYGGRKKGT